MRILYVGNKIKKISGGADVVNMRNQTALERISLVEYIELPPCNSFFTKARFYLAGLTPLIIKRVIFLVQSNEYDYVFLSISQLGLLAKKIRRVKQTQKIITFYHNIESYYAFEFVKVSGLHHILFYLACKYNELYAVKYSNYNIVLNDRDGNLLKSIYGIDADDFWPTSFVDKYSDNINSSLFSDKISYLFVGTAFFANIQGIKWFIQNVMPYIPGHLYIAGSGMTAYKSVFESHNITVLGYVDDLAELYASVNFVISPILSGGGMKTKTAEALMYGKTIIGSKEAFEGYKINDQSTYICNTSEDYIYTINSLVKSGKIDKYNSFSRALFIDNYSNDVVIERINNFLVDYE